MTAKIFVGTLRDRPNESYLVLAKDDLDAERFVTATLGDPSPAVEVAAAEGVCLSFTPRDGMLIPQRLVPSVALADAAAPHAAPPA